MNVLFTADTHFGQQRTLELSRRPWSHVDVMDEVLLTKWNSVVGQDDIVYHLGDFGNPDILPRLEGGTICILPGNYDTTEILEELKKDSRVEIIDSKCWDIATPEEFRLPPMKLIHEPENATDRDAFYLYGHIHQLQLVKRNGLNVGIDCHFFKPIGFDVVKFYYDAITKHYDHNVFMGRLGVTR